MGTRLVNSRPPTGNAQNLGRRNANNCGVLELDGSKVFQLDLLYRTVASMIHVMKSLLCQPERYPPKVQKDSIHVDRGMNCCLGFRK